MKKFSIIMLCLGLLLAFSAPASALPYLGPNCEIVKFKFSDYTWLDEGGPIAVGKHLSAIATLTTVSNEDESTIYWNNGDQGAELTGLVQGLRVDSIDSYADRTLYWIDTSTAQFDTYWDTDPDYNPAIVDLDEQIATATDGDLYWSAEFTDYYLLNYWFGPNGVVDDLAPGSDDEFTVTGYFNLTVNNTGRLFDDNLGTDPSGDSFGFTFTSRLYDTDYPNYVYRSEDPILAHVVPEPATMLLFGSGLISLGGMARRRFRKKA